MKNAQSFISSAQNDFHEAYSEPQRSLKIASKTIDPIGRHGSFYPGHVVTGSPPPQKPPKALVPPLPKKPKRWFPPPPPKALPPRPWCTRQPGAAHMLSLVRPRHCTPPHTLGLKCLQAPKTLEAARAALRPGLSPLGGRIAHWFKSNGKKCKRLRQHCREGKLQIFFQGAFSACKDSCFELKPQAGPLHSHNSQPVAIAFQALCLWLFGNASRIRPNSTRTPPFF